MGMWSPHGHYLGLLMAFFSFFSRIALLLKKKTKILVPFEFLKVPESLKYAIHGFSVLQS
jgi:hypothetical protein